MSRLILDIVKTYIHNCGYTNRIGISTFKYSDKECDCLKETN